MLSTTEKTIWKAMESVRGPESLERVKKMRDFAFVHFSDRESAKAAMEHWNKRELDGSVVEVTWARPAHRGTQRQLKRGGYAGIQYVLPPGMGSAASYNPGLPNVCAGRGTYGSSDAQSSSRWKGGRTLIMVPPHIIGPRAPEVVIPQYPGDQSQFQTPRIFSSAEEAKILAAEITLFRLRSAGHTAASSEGYNHTSIGPAGHVRPQPSTASYSAHNGLHTQPDMAITYALRPSQAPGYLVHGEVGGYDTQFCDSQYQVLM